MNAGIRPVALAAAAALSLSAAAQTADFENLTLAPNSFFDPKATVDFRSGGAKFTHTFTNFGSGCCWSGWTYSNGTDTTTLSPDNPASAIAGSGAGGSANYAVGFVDLAPPTYQTALPLPLAFDTPRMLSGAYFTNTTYAALAMQDGYFVAKKFGGETPGNDPDFLKLTITGVDTLGDPTGSVDFYLADYRFADNGRDYIVRDWRFVDLSSLGTVAGLRFVLDTSDVGAIGPNTPFYFAMDSVTAVPEPSTSLAFAAGLGALLFALRRRFAA